MTGIHDSLIVIDGLVISKWSREVFADMRKGGLTAANCTCSIWEGFAETMRNIARWKRWFTDNADLITPVRTTADIRCAKAEGKTGIILGFQKQAAGLVFRQHRGFATAHDVLGPAHRVRRIDGEDLADDQPVEQHADRGQVLFHRGLRGRHLKRLYIGGDVNRLDIVELANAVLLDPGEEVAHGPVIGHPGVFVADLGGEKLNEASRRVIADIGDNRRHSERAAQRCHLHRRRDLDHRRQVAPPGAHGDTL
jgi:hypothetical protein